MKKPVHGHQRRGHGCAGYRVHLLCGGRGGEIHLPVPIEALDQDTDCAAWSIRKQKWYNRVLVFESDGLPEEAFVHTRFFALPLLLAAAAAIGRLLARRRKKKNMKTVGEEAFAHYVYNGQTRLRCGYTRHFAGGAGAARLLLTGHVGAVVMRPRPKA